jgi:hypothetical protein
MYTIINVLIVTTEASYLSTQIHGNTDTEAWHDAYAWVGERFDHEFCASNIRITNDSPVFLRAAAQDGSTIVQRTVKECRQAWLAHEAELQRIEREEERRSEKAAHGNDDRALRREIINAVEKAAEHGNSAHRRAVVITVAYERKGWTPARVKEAFDDLVQRGTLHHVGRGFYEFGEEF